LHKKDECCHPIINFLTPLSDEAKYSYRNRHFRQHFPDRLANCQDRSPSTGQEEPAIAIACPSGRGDCSSSEYAG
jgi:hypothetical protein